MTSQVLLHHPGQKEYRQSRVQQREPPSTCGGSSQRSFRHTFVYYFRGFFCSPDGTLARSQEKHKSRGWITRNRLPAADVSRHSAVLQAARVQLREVQGCVPGFVHERSPTSRSHSSPSKQSQRRNILVCYWVQVISSQFVQTFQDLCWCVQTNECGTNSCECSSKCKIKFDIKVSMWPCHCVCQM